MLKLSTILKLRDHINTQKQLLQELTDTYLECIDDDLWTVDLPCKPSLTNDILCDDFRITFTTDTKLTDKYIKRFCEDFGLKLTSYTEKDYNYTYFFEVQS